MIDGLRYRPHATHFTIDEAIEQSRIIGAKKTYITHICHEIEHEEVSQNLPQGVMLAYDGLEIGL